MMDFLADILLAAAALGSGGYCFVLARRLSRFTKLDSNMGAAIAVLSKQVDEMQTTLDTASANAKDGAEQLVGLTERAEKASTQLELLLASLHDLPADPPPPPVEANSTFVRHPRSGMTSNG